MVLYDWLICANMIAVSPNNNMPTASGIAIAVTVMVIVFSL